ncbi:MAG: NfeD family protein [Tidjanibacter sp.]|nr:NfeD family protein [Tidjanibacter sp.]
MGLIIFLIVLGMFLTLVEMILLPGISLAAIGAVISYGFAVYKSYLLNGIGGLVICVLVSLVSVVITLIFCVKTKAWHRLTLKDNIDSKSQQSPEELGVVIGDKAVCLTRLAPMGKVEIKGQIYEAKSLDAYIDPKTEVDVIGFENFNVIVRLPESKS